MDFRSSVPIIEGKLYAWGFRQGDKPDPIVSRPLDEPMPDIKSRRDSQPEVWVLKNQYESWENKVINDALQRMDKQQRVLIKLRYVDRMRWTDVAKNMNCEHRTCFRIRDGILMVLAYEFNLLGEKAK